MKLTIDAKVLAAAAADAAKAIPRRPHLPILACLRLDPSTESGHVTLAGFDYDTSLTVALPVDVESHEGPILLPGRALAQFAARLKGDVVLEVVDGIATLSAGRTKITLHTLPTADYPALPEPQPAVLTVDGAALAAAVAAVAPAVSADGGLPVLTGIYVELGSDTLDLTATDRYVIAHRRLPALFTDGGVDQRGELVQRTAILSGRVLADVTKGLSGPVSIGLDQAGASITTPDRVVTLRALAGDYPDLARFLTADPSTTVELDRADLLDALDLARSATDDRNVPIVLDIVTGQVTAQHHVDYSRGDDTQQLLGSLDAVVTGDSLTIGVKPDYLADIARNVTGERITLGLTTARKPVYVTTDDGVHLCMPIALPKADQ